MAEIPKAEAAEHVFAAEIMSSDSSTLTTSSLAGSNLQDSRDTTVTHVSQESSDGKDAHLDLLQKILQQLEVDRANKSESKIDGVATITTMYCPKNGRLHSKLLEHAFVFCPNCGQTLDDVITTEQDKEKDHETLPKPAQGDTDSSSDSGSAPDWETSLKKHRKKKRSHKEKNSKAIYRPVPHHVQFLDLSGESITEQIWPEEFDMAKARRGLGNKRPELPVFEVKTTLSTSIPSRPYWDSDRVERLLEEGILDNPMIKSSINSTEIIIWSSKIIKALSKVVKYYPSVNLESDTLRLQEPYTIIGHHFRQLEDIRKSPQDHLDHTLSSELTSIHLGILLDFATKNVYKNAIAEEEARHSRGTCTFRMLWLLFQPGTTVYRSCASGYSAYVVRSVSVHGSMLREAEAEASSPYVIDVWYLDYDGHYVGRCLTHITIGSFEGERKITTLKVFPAEFIDRVDGGKLRREIEARGIRWYELLCGRQVYYSGTTVGETNKKLEGRVYVDPTTYLTTGDGVGDVELDDIGDTGTSIGESATCACEECQNRRSHPPVGFLWSSYEILDPHKVKDLTLKDSVEGPMHRYLLCHWEIAGFDLKSRKWEWLEVSSCHDPKPNYKAMDTLVMPPERKGIIKALVQKFSTESGSSKPINKAWAADFLENKGEGRIFLLHGSPGVGKTYTAGKSQASFECIAEYTGRALLSLTCADIGTDEVEMERKLDDFFAMGQKWGAVILIDEADVYLEQRSKTDLKRNSLVSVFLRCIEYYRGILFLTTNRVGHFDDAFISRIHIVIKYDNLGEDYRRKIWTQFFAKLTDERHDFLVTGRAKAFIFRDGPDAICKLEWNGREIRNVFQTAVALAEYRFLQKQNKTENDFPELDQTDFEQVCEMTKMFKNYLDDLHGLDEDNRAFYYKARNAVHS